MVQLPLAAAAPTGRVIWWFVTVPITLLRESVSVPERSPTSLSTPFWFTNRMFDSVPVNVPPPFAIVPVTWPTVDVALGAAAGATGANTRRLTHATASVLMTASKTDKRQVE